MGRDKQTGRVELRVRDGRIVVCPVCSRFLVNRISPRSAGRDLPFYCRQCKRTFWVDVEDGRVWAKGEPRA